MQKSIILGLCSAIVVLLLAALYIYAGMYIAQTSDSTMMMGELPDDTISDRTVPSKSAMTDEEVAAMLVMLESSATSSLTDEEMMAFEARVAADDSVMTAEEVTAIQELLSQ